MAGVNYVHLLRVAHRYLGVYQPLGLFYSFLGSDSMRFESG